MYDTLRMRNPQTGTVWDIPAHDVAVARLRGLVEHGEPDPAAPIDDAVMDRELRDGGSEAHDPEYTEAVQAHEAPTIDEAAVDAQNAEPAPTERPESTTVNDPQPEAPAPEDVSDGQSQSDPDSDAATETGKRSRRRQ